MNSRTPPVSVNQQQYPVFTAAPTATPDIPLALFNATESTPYPELGVIEDMLDAPAQLDWVSRSFELFWIWLIMVTLALVR